MPTMRPNPPGLATEPPTPLAAQALDQAAAELARLDHLLAEASRRLFSCFAGASQLVNSLQADGSDADQWQALRAQLSQAAVALQFEDLAHQMLAHVQTRLGQAANAAAVTPDAPLALGRPCPVGPTSVQAGSIDFF